MQMSSSGIDHCFSLLKSLNQSFFVDAFLGTGMDGPGSGPKACVNDVALRHLRLRR